MKVSITADADGVKRGTRDAERSLDRLDRKGTKSLGSLKAGAVGAGAAVGVGLVTGLTLATKAAMESEKVSRQTEQAIKSTGKAAGVTADQVGTLAQSLSKKAAVDDEAVQSGQNLLLTFTKIRNETGKGNDIFNRSSAVMLDLSRAMGTDVNSAAMQLGKALNDPVKGAGALSRAGVQLTQGQKEQIKSFVAAGDAMSAQKLILKELETQVGGSAAAYGSTAAGAVDRAKVAFEGLGEAVGARVTPVVAVAANGFANFLNQMGSGQGAGARFTAAMRSAAQSTTSAWSGVKAFFADIFNRTEGNLARFRKSVRSLAGPIRETVNGMVAAFRKAFSGDGDGDGIGASLRNITVKLVKFSAAVGTYIVVPIVKRVLPGVRQAFEGMANIIGGALKVIDGILSGDFGKMWDGVKQIFRGGIKSVIGLMRISTAPLREAASAIGSAIMKPLRAAWDKTVDAAVGFVNAILSVIDKIPGVNVGRVSAPGATPSGPGGGGRPRPASGVQTRAMGGKITAPTVIMGEEAPRHPEWVIATNPAYRARNVGLWQQAGRDLGMFQGGPLDSVGDALSQTPSVRLAEAAYDTVSGAISRLPRNPFGGAYKGIGGYALSKAKSYIKSKLSGALGGKDASGVGAFDPIARRYGLAMTSAYRPGDPGWHGKGRARDYSDGYATPNELRFAKFMARTYGSRLKELIHTPLGFGIKNGQRIGSFGARVDADHFDHVHVAFRQGGVRGGKYLSTAYGPPWDAMNGTGVTKTGVNLKNAPKRYGIAVDPSMIPLGSRVKVSPNPFGYSGAFEAFDTGGAIRGNRIDFYDWRGRQAQMGWGRRSVTVTPYGGTTPSGGSRRRGGSGVKQGGATSSPGGRTPRGQKLISGVTVGGLGGLGDVPDGFDAIGRMPTPQEIEDAKLAANLGLSGLTAGQGDDLAATVALRDSVRRKLDAAVGRGDSAAITELSGQLKGLNESVGDLTSAVRYEGAEATAQALSAELVKAQVATPDDLSDDINVLTQQLTNATDAYNVAVANNDTAAIIKWGSDIVGLRGSIDQLTNATTAQTAAIQDQNEILKQQALDWQKMAATSGAQTDALKGWLLDFVSSGIGRQVGAGMGTPSYAGGLART